MDKQQAHTHATKIMELAGGDFTTVVTPLASGRAWVIVVLLDGDVEEVVDSVSTALRFVREWREEMEELEYGEVRYDRERLGSE
jgi:hypothetical protein